MAATRTAPNELPDPRGPWQEQVVPPGVRAVVTADSVAPTGDRLTTLLVRMGLIVWQEALTHRDLSRGSGSARAIPIAQRIKLVAEDPFVPDRFPKKQKGMQPAEYTVPGTDEHAEAEATWLRARDHAVDRAVEFDAQGVHKEIANRVLHPYLWQEAIISATDWDSFDRLRLAPDAQRQIRQAAIAMRRARDASIPAQLGPDDWHLPLTGFPGDEELDTHDLIRVSVGRGARVSYLTHEGERDPAADIDLYERVRAPRHLSPFEHPSHPQPGRHANFTGFKQARWYVERDLEPPTHPAQVLREASLARMSELQVEYESIVARDPALVSALHRRVS